MKEQIDHNNIPQHVAIIMDGNGRWAKGQGHDRIQGHKNGVRSVRDVTEIAAELGIQYVTLYAFSTENWNRPIQEVDALMELLVETIQHEVGTLNENNIRLMTIGAIESLPKNAQNNLNKAIADTASNTGMVLSLALSYSSRWEITEAVKSIAEDVASGRLSLDDINDSVVSNHLNTKGIPDPELLIRTSGEMRISNFLLWQIAYSELYFTDTLWPDFGKEEFCKALVEFQRRERRFGKTSEQIKN